MACGSCGGGANSRAIGGSLTNPLIVGNPDGSMIRALQLNTDNLETTIRIGSIIYVTGDGVDELIDSEALLPYKNSVPATAFSGMVELIQNDTGRIVRVRDMRSADIYISQNPDFKVIK